jgi:hypothetical protein
MMVTKSMGGSAAEPTALDGLLDKGALVGGQLNVHIDIMRGCTAVGLSAMPDEFLITCPFCGEQLEIYVEPDVNGSFVQDCEVCCHPWRVQVSGRGDDRVAHVARADGSE